MLLLGSCSDTHKVHGHCCDSSQFQEARTSPSNNQHMTRNSRLFVIHQALQRQANNSCDRVGRLSMERWLTTVPGGAAFPVPQLQQPWSNYVWGPTVLIRVCLLGCPP